VLPGYIEARIRRSPPEGCSVVPGSTPVVAFGNARTARFATLGLNPSRIEFCVNGVELDGPDRRLATLRSLGVSSLQDAPPEKGETVLKECDRYFQRNPYRKWFDPLDEILRAVEATYYGKEANACHLDLVQWATDPTWGGLDRPARERLLSEDLPFLLDQIRRGRFLLLLVNGNGVLRVLQDAVPCSMRLAGRLLIYGSLASGIFQGDLDGVRIIAWTVNLQSSHGVSKEFRKMLADRIAAITSD
jgi:hypothetical protein